MTTPRKQPRKPPANAKNVKAPRARKGAVKAEVAVQVPPADEGWLEPDAETVWPRPWMGPFLDALSVMPFVSQAAQSVGITPQHINRCQSQMPEFDEAVKQAKVRARGLLKRYAWQLGTRGVEQTVTKTKVVVKDGREVLRETTTEAGRLIDPATARFMLASLEPETFSRSVQVRHTGGDGGPVRHVVHRPTDPERALELARITVELEESDIIELAELDEEHEEVVAGVEGSDDREPDGGAVVGGVDVPDGGGDEAGVRGGAVARVPESSTRARRLGGVLPGG